MRIGRNLGVLLAAIFLIACAEELWWRFVPDYLRALGTSVGVVAIYGTFKDLLDAVYQFPGGLLTQRIGYRAALVTFNAMAICGYVAFVRSRARVDAALMWARITSFAASSSFQHRWSAERFGRSRRQPHF